MEFGGEANGDRIAAAARGILGVDMGVEGGDLRLCQFAGELTHHEALEFDPDIERVARFLPARRRHHGDAVAAQFDQAFGGELPQRMPRDGAADPEAFAERILRQFGAGLQRLLDDGAAQRAADDADLVGGFS